MSYIPDYRGKDNEQHLTPIDRAYLAGYRHALDNAFEFFSNADDFDGEIDVEKVAEAINAFERYMDANETEMVCSMFDHADYIGEDVELIDHNKPLYTNTKGAKSNE